MSSGNKVVIGLDFGTTYSAIAYSDQVGGGDCNINSIQAILEWPGPRSTNEKVPSRISYGPPPAVEIKWGYQIKPNDRAKPHVLMKLKLDERLKRSKQMTMLLKFLAGLESLSIDDLDSEDEEEPPEYPGKSPVEVVADYLSEVRKHAWSKLEVKYGTLFKTLTKELVITVPAVWSERAKDLTLKAVTKAQFDVSKISIVTEPEAAAVYTLKYMAQQQDQVRTNDYFVLCDAGGGTVDLISYKITRIAPTYGVEEAVVGNGDKCGATFVEKEFLNWLKNWIGEEAYKKIPPAKLRHGNRLMDDFETYKMNFTGTEEGEEFQVILPRECDIADDDDKSIEDYTLTFTSDQMKQFFEPCVNRTLELIDGQVMDLMRSGCAKPKMILVVGGFGRNAFLFNRISEYAAERGIETRTPDAPWSAVVRGAVCRGLEGPQSGLVEVRLARKHYGTAVSQPFIPGIHDPQDRYIDEYDGHPYARGQMRWLVDKKERLPEKDPKVASISCSASFHLNEDRHFGAVLSACDSDDAPQRFAHDDVHNICRVKADLSNVPLHKFTKNRVGLEGKEYYSCSFKLQAIFVGGNIEWSFIFDGKSYASVTVSYDS